MAKVSISEAARMAGISRSYLYRKYITPGVISTEKDSLENPVIDTAEIIRVFGKLQSDSEQVTENRHLYTPENDSKITFLEEKLQLLSEQLTAAREREKIANERENRLMNQIGQLTGQLDTTTRLLEHKAPEPEKKRRWWQFS